MENLRNEFRDSKCRLASTEKSPAERFLSEKTLLCKGAKFALLRPRSLRQSQQSGGFPAVQLL